MVVLIANSSISMVIACVQYISSLMSVMVYVGIACKTTFMPSSRLSGGTSLNLSNWFGGWLVDIFARILFFRLVSALKNWGFVPNLSVGAHLWTGVLVPPCQNNGFVPRQSQVARAVCLWIMEHWIIICYGVSLDCGLWKHHFSHILTGVVAFQQSPVILSHLFSSCSSRLFYIKELWFPNTCCRPCLAGQSMSWQVILSW